MPVIAWDRRIGVKVVKFIIIKNDLGKGSETYYKKNQD